MFSGLTDVFAHFEEKKSIHTIWCSSKYIPVSFETIALSASRVCKLPLKTCLGQGFGWLKGDPFADPFLVSEVFVTVFLFEDMFFGVSQVIVANNDCQERNEGDEG